MSHQLLQARSTPPLFGSIIFDVLHPSILAEWVLGVFLNEDDASFHRPIVLLARTCHRAAEVISRTAVSETPICLSHGLFRVIRQCLRCLPAWNAASTRGKRELIETAAAIIMSPITIMSIWLSHSFPLTVQQTIAVLDTLFFSPLSSSCAAKEPTSEGTTRSALVDHHLTAGEAGRAGGAPPFSPSLFAASQLRMPNADHITRADIHRIAKVTAGNLVHVQLHGVPQLSELEALLLVCPNLRVLDLHRAKLCDIKQSTVFLESINKGAFNLHSLRLSNTSITDFRPLFIAANPALMASLQCLDLSDTDVNNEGIEGVEFFANLRELRLRMTKVTDVTRVIACCRAMVTLDLKWCDIKVLPGVEWLTNLKELYLGKAVPLDICTQLEHCPALEVLSLSIRNAEELAGGSVRGIGRLDRLPNLVELQAVASKIDSVACLAHSRCLRTLSLSLTKVNDIGISGIGSVASLEELSLSTTLVTSVSGNIGAWSLSLRRLTLRGCEVRSEGIVGIQLAPSLQELDLTQTRVENVSCLRDCPRLRYLSLARCAALETSGILGLERIATLTTLDLAQTSVGHVNHLASCASLSTLSLSGAKNVTTAGISQLHRLSSLRHLNLSGTAVDHVGHLQAATSLMALNLDLTRVTTDGIVGLERCPKLIELNVCRTPVSRITHLLEAAIDNRSSSLSSLSFSFRPDQATSDLAHRGGLLTVESNRHVWVRRGFSVLPS